MMLKIHRMRGGDSSAMSLIDKWARLGFATSRHHMPSTQPGSRLLLLTHASRTFMILGRFLLFHPKTVH
jgi:hypothetical protein